MSFIRHRGVVPLIFGSLLALAAGCHNVGVTVKGGNNYEGDLGILNSAQFDLGSVVALNPETHHAFRVIKVDVPDSATGTTPSVGTHTENVSTNFSLAFSADVPQSVNVAVNSAVTSSTTLTVENYSVKSVNEPLAFAKGNPKIVQSIEEIATAYPTWKFFYVYAVVPADRVYMKYNNTNSANASANILKTGNFTVNVSYAVNADLETKGKQSLMFIKREPLKVVDNAGQKTLELDGGFIEKLSDYDLVDALELRWHPQP